MSDGDRAAAAVVTGGAGAIGSFLVRSLLSDGAAVRVVDNFSSGRRNHLPAAPPDGRLTVHEADLRRGAPDAAFRGAGVVWHLAANPDIRLGTAEPSTDLEHGTVSTFNVLEAARKHDVERVLFSSSSVVYGLPSVYPTPEEYGPLLPQSLYGASKLAGEGLVSAYAATYGLRGFIFRYANIIGPTMTHGVIVDFFGKLAKDPRRLEVLGDGRQSKSYLWVEDCVEGMRVAESKARDRVNVFNLGSADRVSVREIAQLVIQAVGVPAKIEYTGGERGWAGDVPQQWLSIDRIGRLGWRPRLNSRAAVQRAIDAFAAKAAPPRP